MKYKIFNKDFRIVKKLTTFKNEIIIYKNLWQQLFLALF